MITWPDALKIIGVTLSIGGVAYAAIRFVLTERETQSRLTGQIDKLQQQLQIVSATIREDVTRYQALQEVSSSAQTALDADLHSISIPVPRASPTHFRIIVSTDPQAEKIIGKEFPITKGLAAKVYQSLRPEYINRAVDDPKHYRVVDQAAGTNTGEGAILTYPLIHEGACCGLVQFMKRPGSGFMDEDIAIAGRFANRIASELASLEQSGNGDVHFGSVPEIFATVLFTDINDYSKIARQVSLHQCVSILDEYYRRMLEIALGHGAAFEEYVGDGLYLSFRAASKSDAVASAISCAQGMQDEFETLQSEWLRYEYPISEHNYHNIGIASGNVFEGTVGHLQHRKRKLIGSPVDRAAHLVEKAKSFSGCLMIDKGTRDLISATDLAFEEKTKDPRGYIVTRRTV